MSISPIDPLLAIGVVAVAWTALASTDLFRAVILFIAFGLLMALTWVRLEAPDIALAEAAIGAGLTGAILLDAVGQLARKRAGDADPSEPAAASAHPAASATSASSPAPAASVRDEGGSTIGDARPGTLRAGSSTRATAAVLSLLLFALLLHAVTRLPSAPGGLTRAAADALERSGVSNPVTAVLLNFRSYDTWLEVVVLVVAVSSVLLLRGSAGLAAARARSGVDPMLRGMARTLLPVMVLVGGYLLWRGTAAPGGAFQAGAILGSTGVLLLLSGYRPFHRMPGIRLRAGLLAGLAAFLVASVAFLVLGQGFMELPHAQAGQIILLLEGAVTVAIALTLTALFAGAGTPIPDREASTGAGPAESELEAGGGPKSKSDGDPGGEAT